MCVVGMKTGVKFGEAWKRNLCRPNQQTKGAQASSSARPAPTAASAVSAWLTCRQHGRSTGAPLCCVYNCSLPAYRKRGLLRELQGGLRN